MRYFDLHCDTPHELYNQNALLDENDLHVSLNKAAVLSHYAQVMAIWTPKRFDDEKGFNNFNKVMDHLNVELYRLRDRVQICRIGEEIIEPWQDGKTAVFLAVEDARLLGGDISRLKVLYGRGVRFLTLCWGGSSCIGGSHDTQDGLTPFGELVVQTCFDMGIIPDLSHASDATANQVLAMAKEAGKPVIATHSNSRTVYNHTRNLTDEQFCAIRDLGGIVGISFCPPHLTDTKEAPATIQTLLKHIDHYLDLGGEYTVAMGGDLDGISRPPEGIRDISDIPAMEQAMIEHGYHQELIDHILWKNAHNFVCNHLQ